MSQSAWVWQERRALTIACSGMLTSQRLLTHIVLPTRVCYPPVVLLTRAVTARRTSTSLDIWLQRADTCLQHFELLARVS